MKNENKWKRYTKKAVKEWKQGGLIALGLGLFFAIAGIFGSVMTNTDYREYKSSDDIRSVEATITNVTRKYKDKDKNRDEKVWEAEYTYIVEGKEYRYYTEFKHPVEVGNRSTLEVYRNSRGDYRVPISTSAAGVGFYTILYSVMTLLGIFLLGGGVYCLYGSRKIAQALEQKAKEREEQYQP